MPEVENAPPPSSLVHPDEITGSSFEEFYSALPTNGDSDPLTPYQRFRFRSCRGLREKLRSAMIAADLPTRTIARYDACGSHCQLYHSPSTDTYSIRGDFCKCRTCVPCAVARRRLIASNLTRFLGDRFTRMTTLTLCHKNAPLQNLITRMWASFKLLRKTEEFQQNMTGWAAFLEVKWSTRSSWWHVHLHIISEGRFWDKRELSRTWHACTGDSYIVDIQAKGTNEDRAYYCSKYASKPFDASSIPSFELLTDAVANLHRRKLWQVGGNWKSLRLLDKPKSDVTDWEYACPLNQLFNDAHNGKAEAIALVEAICNAEEEKTPSLIPNTS